MTNHQNRGLVICSTHHMLLVMCAHANHTAARARPGVARDALLPAMDVYSSTVPGKHQPLPQTVKSTDDKAFMPGRMASVAAESRLLQESIQDFEHSAFMRETFALIF
eukprot:3855900-Amphidinium_carterae.1